MPEIEECTLTDIPTTAEEAEAQYAYYEAHKDAAAKYGKKVFEKAGIRGVMVFRIPREGEFYVGVCNDNTPSTSRLFERPYCVRAGGTPPNSYGACQRMRFVFVPAYQYRNQAYKIRDAISLY